MSTTLLFLIGLALIIGGAELLVRGAIGLSKTLGIPPLIVGLTVVAFGTASPELAVCIDAARNGHSDISVGNIVGSNILNVLLILGLAAIVRPLAVAQQLVRLDVPIMIGASGLLMLVVLDRTIGMMDGVLFCALLVGYLILVVRISQKESREVQKEYENQYSPDARPGILRTLIDLATIGIGLTLLLTGTPRFVQGAVAIAQVLGLSEHVISLTIVSVGTSLPELATSVLASIRGQRDIAVGNVVGSNIFNIFAVLGISTLVAGGYTVSPAAIHVDIPVMIAAAFLCLPVFLTRNVISRGEGLLFVGYYVAYAAYLLLSVTDHGLLPIYRTVLIYVVIPLTLIPVLIGLLRAMKRR